jgi:thioredoxin-dependent peroxiredoxin
MPPTAPGLCCQQKMGAVLQKVRLYFEKIVDYLRSYQPNAQPKENTMEKLNVGDPAPPFEVMTDTGERVKLSDYRGKRVVLYFYPKDDTPGCTTQACGFRDAYPAIEEKNAVVLGVSPDDEKSHVKFKSKFNLPFTLLVDADHAIAEAYGVWGEKTNYGKTYMGIIRSNFVIDETGKIIKTMYNIKPADSAAEALAALN